MAPMLQHLVYQHPGLSVQPSPPQHRQQQLLLPSQQHPSGMAVSLTPTHRQLVAADLSPKSSHSGDTPLSGGNGRSVDGVHSPPMSRNNEAQSWTFEEQFRQVSGYFTRPIRVYVLAGILVLFGKHFFGRDGGLILELI